jgi:hypothetical protein
MTLSILTPSTKGLFATLTIMTLSVMTPSTKGLFATLIIMILSINTQHKGLICDTQHNDTLNKVSSFIYCYSEYRHAECHYGENHKCSVL